MSLQNYFLEEPKKQGVNPTQQIITVDSLSIKAFPYSKPYLSSCSINFNKQTNIQNIQKLALISQSKNSIGNTNTGIPLTVQKERFDSGKSTQSISISESYIDKDILSVLYNIANNKDGNININEKGSSELTDIKEQLEVQLKVNADLKKLLVASIGDDLHHKVDVLVRTKVQLANEIEEYTSKLLKDYEDLDKITIQADIWHSKYRASKTLINQLMSDREKLLNSYLQAQNALQYGLEERRYLYNLLFETNRNLLSIHDNLINYGNNNPFESNNKNYLNTLELCESNKDLTTEINKYILKNFSDVCHITMPFIDDNNHKLTHAELLAKEEIMKRNDSIAKLGHGAIGTKQLPRFHPHTKYFDVTFNCCSKCKGEIISI